MSVCVCVFVCLWGGGGGGWRGAIVDGCMLMLDYTSNP